MVNALQTCGGGGGDSTSVECFLHNDPPAWSFCVRFVSSLPAPAPALLARLGPSTSPGGGVTCTLGAANEAGTTRVEEEDTNPMGAAEEGGIIPLGAVEEGGITPLGAAEEEGDVTTTPVTSSVLESVASYRTTEAAVEVEVEVEPSLHLVNATARVVVSSLTPTTSSVLTTEEE